MTHRHTDTQTHRPRDCETVRLWDVRLWDYKTVLSRVWDCDHVTMSHWDQKTMRPCGHKPWAIEIPMYRDTGHEIPWHTDCETMSHWDSDYVTMCHRDHETMRLWASVPQRPCAIENICHRDHDYETTRPWDHETMRLTMSQCAIVTMRHETMWS